MLPRRSTPPLPPSSRSIADLSELRAARASPEKRRTAAIRPPKPSKQSMPGAQGDFLVQAAPQAAVERRNGESGNQPAGNGHVLGAAAPSTAQKITVAQEADSSAVVGAEPEIGSSSEEAAQAQAEVLEAHEATSSDRGRHCAHKPCDANMDLSEMVCNVMLQGCFAHHADTQVLGL